MDFKAAQIKLLNLGSTAHEWNTLTVPYHQERSLITLKFHFLLNLWKKPGIEIKAQITDYMSNPVLE